MANTAQAHGRETLAHVGGGVLAFVEREAGAAEGRKLERRHWAFSLSPSNEIRGD